MRTLTFPQFVALEGRPQLNETLEVAYDIGCVLDYLPFPLDVAPDAATHRKKVLAAMQRVVAFYEHRARTMSNRHYPLGQFLRVSFDPTKLKGEPIDAAQFWGNDDAETKWDNGVGFGPVVDGYKTAFCIPPHRLQGELDGTNKLSRNRSIFEELNAQLWGDDLSDCTIYNWSTEWSNYFDEGHEYWGAFCWTVYSPQTQLLTVIMASATD